MIVNISFYYFVIIVVNKCNQCTGCIVVSPGNNRTKMSRGKSFINASLINRTRMWQKFYKCFIKKSLRVA